MIRRLFTVLSALSLVLGVTTCVLWARSGSTTDSVKFEKDGSQWRVASSSGHFFMDNQPQVDADEAENRRRFQDNRRWWREVHTKREAIGEEGDRLHESFMALFHGFDRLIPKRLPLLPDLDYWIIRVGFEFKMALLDLSLVQQHWTRVKYSAESEKLDALFDETTSYPSATLVTYGPSIAHPWVFGGSAVPPLLWLTDYLRRSYGRRRRLKAGLCLSCGYDLRASPDRCSECGEVPVGVKG